MIDTVRETIARHAMLRRGDSVAVGLSGGADSVSLLCALLEVREELDLTVRAVHINHGIRGESADRDEEFCRQLCARLDVELECIRLDIPAIAAQRGIGLEQCGRECRYEQFAAVAQKHGCKIATAHTLSDSAETVLFNLARGSGLVGVCGIPPVRELTAEDSSVTVIRPLIGVTREDVEGYCARHGLAFVTDESNADTVYRRNLIRSAVIPALREVNPSLHSAIDRFTESVREDCAYLDRLAAQAVADAALETGWNASEIAALPEPLLRRAITIIARSRNCTPEYAQVMLCVACVREGSGGVMLTQGVRFAVERGMILLDDGLSPLPEPQWAVPLTFPQTVLPDGRVLTFEQIDTDSTAATQKHQKLLFKNALSCGIIKNNVYVRNRREGDRFAPVGRGVTKRLKKLLCEEGIPAAQRGQLAVIASDSDILWVEGFGASEQGRPAPDDTTALLPVISGKEK